MYERTPNPWSCQSLATLAPEQVHPGLAEVTCERRADVAVLRGQVPTFYLKQLAQEAAAKIDGIQSVVNQVQVCTRRPPGLGQ